MTQHRWKLASLVKTGTEDLGNLLDQRVRGNEGIVSLGCRRKNTIISSTLTIFANIRQHTVTVMQGTDHGTIICGAQKAITTSDIIIERRYRPSFLINFLFLLSFFNASTSINGMSRAFASSQCCWSPRTHTFSLGFGMWRNLQVDYKMKRRLVQCLHLCYTQHLKSYV